METKIKTPATAIPFQNILLAALAKPGVRIERDGFLRNALQNRCSGELVTLALQNGPRRAGISDDFILEQAQLIVHQEVRKLTAVTVRINRERKANSLKRGHGLALYLAYGLRTSQKLAYLYDYPDFEFAVNRVDSNLAQLMMVYLDALFDMPKELDELNSNVNRVLHQVGRFSGKSSPLKTICAGAELSASFAFHIAHNSLTAETSTENPGMIHLLFRRGSNDLLTKLQRNELTYSFG